MISLSFNKLLKREFLYVLQYADTKNDARLGYRRAFKCRSFAFLVLPAELLSRTAYRESQRAMRIITMQASCSNCGLYPHE